MAIEITSWDDPNNLGSQSYAIHVKVLLGKSSTRISDLHPRLHYQNSSQMSSLGFKIIRLSFIKAAP